VLARRGASFFSDLVPGSGLLPTQVEQALADLATAGLVTSDSFAGLRALLTPASRRGPVGGRTGRHRAPAAGVESAGRWSRLEPAQSGQDDDVAIEACARAYLLRYGVVFKRVLARESLAIPWRRLVLVYRRLEARGEIRGGRFVSGMSGEQFALPEAVGQLRALRRERPRGLLLSISAADPLNLVGIVTPGQRITALRRNRILFQDGVPLAALEGGVVRPLAPYDPARAQEIERALIRRRALPSLDGRKPAAGE
jgi:ATP-dependent Lhr-like helicase